MSIFSQGLLKGYIRLSLIAIWAVLFISYFAIFVTHLQTWDNNVPQHCYQTAKISRKGDAHPLVDNVYVGITFACTLATLVYAFVYALAHKSHQHDTTSATAGRDDYERWIGELLSKPDLTRDVIKASFQDFARLYWQLATVDNQDSLVRIALLQCPLHIYSMFALKSANERDLEGGSEEREWGFGQVVAVVLLGTIVLTVADALSGKREIKGNAEGDELTFIDLVEKNASMKNTGLNLLSGRTAEHVADEQCAVELGRSITTNEDGAGRFRG